MYKILRTNSVLPVYAMAAVLAATLLLSQLPARTAYAADASLNINTASIAELAQTLPGIGPAKAKAIVVFREAHGAFRTLDALIEVKGIGPRTLEKIRGYLFVSDSDANNLFNKTNSSMVSGVSQSQATIEHLNTRAVRAAVSIARRNGRSVYRSQVSRH